MSKIFFFNKRNPATGEVLDVVIDAEERQAHNFWKNGTHYKYVGWSDGSAIAKLKNELPRLETNEKTGMKVKPSQDIQQKVRAANQAEYEAAKVNPDKTPPRDLTKIQFGNPSRGGQVGVMNPDILSRLPK